MEKIKVTNDRPTLYLDADVTYSQVNGWYGHTTRDLKMDVMYPDLKTDELWPCIIWVCGGAWMQMDHHAHLPNLEHFLRQGFVVVSPEYRDSNDGPYPAPLDDLMNCINYLEENYEKYHIDPTRIGIIGESAGAHLAAMTGLKDSRIKAVCTWYLPSDLTGKKNNNSHYDVIMPTVRLLRETDDVKFDILAKEASPLFNIHDKTPPFFIIHGDQDVIVDYEQSVNMHKKLLEEGRSSELLILEGAGHGDTNFYQEEIMNRMLVFFKKNISQVSDN